MSCQSICVSYSVPSKGVPKESSFANTTFPSLARTSKTIVKHTRSSHKSYIDFPYALCHRCRQLVHFRNDGFTVPCVCKFKGEICDKCKQLDPVQAILDYAGEVKGTSVCKSGYTPVAPVSKVKRPLHEYLCILLQCKPDELVSKLHIKTNYDQACHALNRRKLTCKYLDDTYILDFDRFTYKGAEKERMTDGSGLTIAQYLQAKRDLGLEHPTLPCIVTRGKIRQCVKYYKFPLECVLIETGLKK